MAGLKVNTSAEGRKPLAETSGNIDMHNVNRFPSSKLKLDEFFLNWLSSPESQKLVLNLLDDAKAGRPLQAPALPATPTGQSPLSPSSTSALLGAALATPPLSPQKGAAGAPAHGSPGSPSRRASARAAAAAPPTSPAPAPPPAPSPPETPAARAIPRFYHPPPTGEGRRGVKAFPEEESATRLADAARVFDGKALDAIAFRRVVRETCDLPSFFAPLVMHRVHDTNPMAEDSSDPATAPGAPTAPAREPEPVTFAAFAAYWNGVLRKYEEREARAFAVIRGETGDERDEGRNKYLAHADFRPLIRCVLDTHPGLEFLKDSPEFQDRYLETVTYRIFYRVNVAWNGRMTLRELRRGDLLEAMAHVDEEEDINKVLRYFSYEHFYVIYCRFWELDGDHDFLIDKEDLLRYGNHALTYRVVDRVFAEAPRKFTSGVKGKMGYEDFCWFILSEEDKSTAPSLEYWFRCVDLDGDGALVPNECKWFYEEQLQRMECLNQEPVLWEDILCQVSDMLSPETNGRVTMRDLRRSKLSGNFFNILFNLNKFVAFETRDPFVIRQEREEPHLTEWDRFARAEYVRLSMEEEEGIADGGELWEGDATGGGGDSPF